MGSAEWRWARIGVCPMRAKGKAGMGAVPVVLQPFDRLTCELIQYSGLLVDWLIPEDLPARVATLDILITIGEGELEDDSAHALQAFVQQGGIWIALGGVCAQPQLFGVHPRLHREGTIQRLGEGYAVGSPSNPVLPEKWGMLHGFGGVAVDAQEGTVWAHWLDAHGRETGLPAIVHRAHGTGHAILFAVHPGESITRIRHGRSVVEPAVLPPDVERDPDDHALRAEDAIHLDWHLDREPFEGGYGFLKPVADLWQESLIRAVLWGGQQRGAVVPMLWFYPDHLPGVAILSIDAEPSAASHELTLQRLLTLTGVRAVWCLSEVSHEPVFYRELAKRGHEIGLRYVPEPAAFCRAATLQNQVDNLRRFSGVRAITAVQVADLHWRGCTEFYAYAEQAQILSDLSRGGYATGAAGFAFGSAHPWRPLNHARPGELHALHVVPLLGYHLIERVSSGQAQAILRMAQAVHGVCHFTVRPTVVENEAKADAFVRMLAAARNAGYEWITAAELARWHTARTAVRHRFTGVMGQMQLALLSSTALSRLTLLLFTPLSGWAQTGSNELPLKPAEHFGYPCLVLETDLVEKTVREITLFEAQEAQASGM
ncbi:MAG: hypothetical protein ABDI19_10355 [Armatimonadota bacterium]